MPEPAGEAAPRLRLCTAAELVERGRARLWDVLQYGGPVRAFALRYDGRVVAYLNRCTHVPTEMDWQPGEFLDADKCVILCALHGASYAPQDGRCLGGPARGALTAVRVAEEDGQVYWYPSRAIQPVTPDASAPGSAA